MPTIYIDKNDPLFKYYDAILLGDINAMRYILDDPESNQIIQNKNVNLLYNAIEYDRIDIFHLLLEDGRFDINKLCYSHIERQDDKHHTVKNRIVIGEYCGRSLLAIAFKKKYFDIVRLLLTDPNIDPNITNEASRQTLLHILSNIIYHNCEQRINIAKLCLEHPKIDPFIMTDPFWNHGSIIESACRNVDVEIVRCLLDDVRILKSLSENPEKSAFLLHVLLEHINANENDRIQICKMLLEMPNININSIINLKHILDECFIIMYFHVHFRILKLLLDDPRIVVTKDVSIMVAINACKCHNNLEAIKYLLDDGRFDFNFVIKDINCFTYVCQNGNSELIQLLLDKTEADPNLNQNKLNSYGGWYRLYMTPIDYAIWYNNTKLLKYIRYCNRFDLHNITKNNETYLHSIAHLHLHHFGTTMFKEYYEIIALFSEVIDPNIQDIEGNTFLHKIAEKYSHANIEKIIELLEIPGFDPSIRNNQDKTVIDILYDFFINNYTISAKYAAKLECLKKKEKIII